MLKLAIGILLICSSVVTSVASAHVVDNCREASECVDHNDHGQVANEQPTKSPTESVPHDCPCQIHHHHCSHQLLEVRGRQGIDGPPEVDLVFHSLLATAIPSPFIDGPFQPPKA